jgi:polysaccharide export outer membrane protein
VQQQSAKDCFLSNETAHSQRRNRLLEASVNYKHRLLSCLALTGIAILPLSFVRVLAQETQNLPAVEVSRQAKSDSDSVGETRPNEPALQHRNPRYHLSRGDTVDLVFPFTPEFNQTVSVNPDGFVTLNGVGDLYVAGKMVPELKELLHATYSTILHDPIINVVLKDFDKPFFIAGGDVAHPGKFDLRSDITLTQAIAIAGGFTDSSKHSQVLLFRRVSNDWAEVKVLNVKKMFQTGNLSEDMHLQPGDMFFVPQNRISKIKKWIPYTSISAGATPTF